MTPARVLAAALVVAACFAACTGPELGETHIQVWIHDAPFRKSGKTVEHLYIQVARIEIHPADGTWQTLSEEPRTLDILAIAANDPVLLSDTPVSPGAYTQLRLVLAEEGNTIVVDGETFPLRIPSSEKTGVKIVRPFVLPEGRLFKFVLDFQAEESVIINANGYQLKPVIKLSQDEDERVQLVYGCFSGFLPLEDVCSDDPATYDGVRIDLTEDGHFTGQATIDPAATLSGDYFYDSEARILEFTNIGIEYDGTEDCSWYDIPCHLAAAVIAGIDVPTMKVALQNWSDDAIRPRLCGTVQVLDLQGPPGSCGLPPIPPPATLTVNVTNLDPAWGPSTALIVEARRTDEGAPADVASAPRNGLEQQTLTLSIPHTRFAGGAAELRVRAFIGNQNAAGTGTDARLSAVTKTVTGSFIARSEKPHNPSPVVTLSPQGSASVDLAFPPRMTISVTPSNFSTRPVFSWTPIPGISRYLITISIPDQDPLDGEGVGGGPSVLPQGDGNSAWDFLMSEVVEGTQYAYVPAGYILHTDLPDLPAGGDLPAGLLPLGTPIRVEVVAIQPGATELTAQTGAGVHSSYVHTFALGGL